jgi:hypothetical protein
MLTLVLHISKLLSDCPFEIFIHPSNKLHSSSLKPFTSPSTKVTLEQLPNEIICLIESVYPPAIKPIKTPIQETWKEPIIARFPYAKVRIPTLPRDLGGVES